MDGNRRELFDSRYFFGANVARAAPKVGGIKLVCTFKCYNKWAFRCKQCWFFFFFFAKGTKLKCPTISQRSAR